MPVGVALYLSGSSRERVLADWDRILATGFASPGRVPGQRPHVSLINGHGDEDTAERLARALEPVFACRPGLECDFGPVAFFSDARRVAYYPLMPNESMRSLHRAVCESATECGVTIYPYYSQKNWVPHCSLSDHVPPEQTELFVAALTEPTGPLSARLHQAGVVHWDHGTGLTQVAEYELLATREAT